MIKNKNAAFDAVLSLLITLKTTIIGILHLLRSFYKHEGLTAGITNLHDTNDSQDNARWNA